MYDTYNTAQTLLYLNHYTTLKPIIHEISGPLSADISIVTPFPYQKQL